MTVALPHPPIAVDEVSSIDEDTFRRDYLARHRPLIVRQAVAHWPAMDWSDDNLRTKLAGHPLRVDVTPHDPHDQLDLNRTWQETMSVSELLLRFSRPDVHHYVHDLNLPPQLHSDLDTHALSTVFPVPRRMTWWWGGDGQISWLHYDDNENFMCQFAGEKEFLLFDVVDFSAMYPRGEHEYRSAIDLEHDHTHDYPEFVRATPYIARIGPGDLLYVPCYWWHRVTSRGERNLAVSYIIHETMAQRVRVAGRLIDAGVLPIDEDDRKALLAIVANRERPARQNAQLRAYHRDYVAHHGRSYYPHSIFHRLIEESLMDILRGHAAY